MKNTREYPFAVTSCQEYTKLSPKWRISPVTVCVAAVFNNSSILGASDRMLTAGDIQFQPQSPKIWPLSNSIAIMMAGDMGLHAQIFQAVAPIVNERIRANPNEWLKVSEIAELYSQTFFDFRLRRAEREILLPLGLNRETFISRQQQLSPNLVEELTTKMLRLRVPETGAIIAGIDGPPNTAHLYVVENGNVRCEDGVGFAAIGAGYWHADSQFMVARHTRQATVSQALLNTFWAKKRAEVAPGVGSETDMFVVGPALGSLVNVNETVIRDLEKIYKQTLRRQRAFNIRTEKAVENYLQVLSKTQAQVPTPPPPPPPAPENKT